MINETTSTSAAQTGSKPMDHAGVRLPPPLLYIVIFGLGWLLQQFAPLSLPVNLPVRVAAILFVAVGVLLIVWANVLFQRNHTSMVPVRPTNTLVIRGPYRLTRNPMYLGLLCIYIGAALWFGTAWALILTPLVVLAVHFQAIAKEERYLGQKFGDSYRQYRTQVRRWI